MSPDAAVEIAVARRLLLLRHSEVDSHRGDVPITPHGADIATRVGRSLGRRSSGFLLLLSGETRRARETAAAIADGARDAGAQVAGPTVAFALRNPDLYLAGVRVDMVSTPATMAEQVPGLSEHAAATAPFFDGWYTADDRVGYWLRHPDPPGDDADTVLRRIEAFARSFTDAGADGPQTVVAVTHSPVLRACALADLDDDPGEPAWVAGVEAELHPDRKVTFRWLPSAPDEEPTP